ncbi:hypothetical protein GGG16DRAFT_128243 [Schizophyllum commune]
MNGPPVTPARNARPSIGLYRSPASTPSIASSIPFDWDAARSHKPAPYGTPLRKKTSGVGGGAPRKAIVRKKSLYTRIRDIPSRIAFEFTQFPNNVPLPSHQTSARILGGLLHFLHLCVRVSQGRAVPDSELGWEDMYAEDTGASWFSWTIPLTLLLLGAAILNAMFLFTRVKIYRLHRRQDPVSSPNAKYVSEELDFEPLEAPSIKEQLWGAFTKSFRWLLGMKPKAAAKTRTATRILQMEVWTPGDVETSLFCVYSPVHALLWMQTGSSNWIMMFAIMALVGFQLHALCRSFKALVKDKEIIAAEVMHEYNEGFVYPRVNPIRKDAAVMTHQSEMVDPWEDYY